MQRFIYLVVLMVLCLAGCGADHPSCKGEIIVMGEQAWCVPDPIVPDPYIGEYCEWGQEWHIIDIETGEKSHRKGCIWHKFRKSDVLDEHRGEIKVLGEEWCAGDSEGGHCKRTGHWQSRYFYYADVPDRFQKKREEIENDEDS